MLSPVCRGRLRVGGFVLRGQLDIITPGVFDGNADGNEAEHPPSATLV